ncbi:hypothetical protein JST97_23375 [bacterium]|nr:hypothetical protein [bacterium]
MNRLLSLPRTRTQKAMVALGVTTGVAGFLLANYSLCWLIAQVTAFCADQPVVIY